MSGMRKPSMWWLFLVLFGLTIGGIQSLGWWARPATAQTPASSACDPYSTAGARRHQSCAPTHWRAMILQQ
jgi:hypothetical protein